MRWVKGKIPESGILGPLLELIISTVFFSVANVNSVINGLENNVSCKLFNLLSFGVEKVALTK